MPDSFHPALMDYLDLPGREALAGITAGTPILVSPELEHDRHLIRYFNTAPEFIGLNAATRESEAREIRTWLGFLDSQGAHWRDAVPAHFRDFRRTRTDPAVVQQLIRAGMMASRSSRLPVVSAGTFAKGHFALRRLYDWAVMQSLIPSSPIPAKVSHGAQAARSKPPKPQWLMPATYQLWRNVGLGGHALERDADGRLRWGMSDPSWKGGVNAGRNQAFTDLMVTSALRRREQSTLLEEELPASGHDSRLASAVAKFNRSRVFTPNPEVMRQVAQYQRLHRAAAVRRAQQAGRYEALARDTDLLVLADLQRHRRAMTFVAENGEEIDLDGADQDQRARMFRRDSEGRLEPMMLWLTEAGRPMRPGAWNDVFEAADLRVADWFGRIRASEESPHVNPHVLRFTFALYLLAALHRRIDEREGYRDTEAYDWRRYGAAYGVVQDMLGHKSEETTVNTYLEAVRGLRQASLFDSTVGMSLAEVIGVLTHGSDRVMRAGTVFEVDG